MSELILLAVFAAGLFSANMIVKSRSHVLLGQTLELPGSGLTVRLPESSRGWQGLTRWQYEMNNSFIALTRSSRPHVEAQWRYILNTTAVSSGELLAQIAGQYQKTLVHPASHPTKTNLECGELTDPSSRGPYHAIAVIVLDFGRALTLEVQSSEDPFFAADVFRSMADSINYTRPEVLSAGIELIQQARRSGPATLFSGEENSNLLIRDKAKSIRGYEQMQIKQDSEGALHIDKTTFINTAAIRRKEQSFESSDPFRAFRWQNRNTSLPGQGAAVFLELNNGTLAVHDSVTSQRTITIGPAAVSEILLEGLTRFMIGDEESKPAALDLISPEGRIIPAMISAVRPSQAFAQAEEIAHVVRIDSLAGYSMEFYYSADKKLLGKVSVEIRGMLLWEPATRQEINQHFDTRPQNSGQRVENTVPQNNRSILSLMMEKS